MNRLLAAFLLLLAVASPAAAQVIVNTITKDIVPLKKTDEVRLIRAESSHGAPRSVPLEKGQSLALGDAIESVSGEILVELRCADGARFSVSRRFKVVIVAPAKAKCALDLLGKLEVLAKKPTEVNAGGVRMGSEGTEYSVWARTEQAGTRLVVFDGKVRVELPKSPLIQAGSFLNLAKRQARETGALQEQDIKETADVLARVDFAKALENGLRPVQPLALLKQLLKLHAAVLRAPSDSEARHSLTRVQLENRIFDCAASNPSCAGLESEDDLRRQGIDFRGQESQAQLMQRRLEQDAKEKAAGRIPPSAYNDLLMSQPGEVGKALKAAEEAGEASSRHYCNFAECEARAAENSKNEELQRSAIEHARKGLQLAQKDRLLLGDEYAKCQRIAQGP